MCVGSDPASMSLTYDQTHGPHAELGVLVAEWFELEIHRPNMTKLLNEVWIDMPQIATTTWSYFETGLCGFLKILKRRMARKIVLLG